MFSYLNQVIVLDLQMLMFHSYYNFWLLSYDFFSVGLTETCAGSFVSLPNQMSMIGTVGPPVPNIDARLESVPEMNYDALASTPRGEICIKGDTLFSGYYRREDLTQEVLVDGWFHTGTSLPFLVLEPSSVFTMQSLQK
jgi:acyl-CoA synthetase (AMP-forming)/AMP-acid ligase II